MRAKFILSPKICVNVTNKMLFLLSALGFVHLGCILVGISSKILNVRTLYHFILKSYHQVININN